MKISDYVGKKFKPKKSPNHIFMKKVDENKVKKVTKINRWSDKKDEKKHYFIHWTDGTVGPFKDAKAVKLFFSEFYTMLST